MYCQTKFDLVQLIFLHGDDILTLEIDNWKYILDNCKDVFEKEPILELAMGLVFSKCISWNN